MGCGCGQGLPQQEPMQMAEIRVNEDGWYAFGAEADTCTEPYTGPWEGMTIYVVDALGTPTYYRRGDRVAAATQARMEGKTLNHVLASMLCRDAVEQLLGDAA